MLAILVTLATMLPGAPQSNAASECGDIQVVGLAGSGELDKKTTSGTNNLGQTNTDFYDKLASLYKGTETRITAHGVKYLAQSVLYFFTHFSYEKSKQSGVDNTLNYLNSSCQNTKLILVGYSQGADAMMAVYSQLSEQQLDRVISVILFADPHFDPRSRPLGQGTYTERAHGQGIFGAKAPRSADFHSKARSYCLVNDPICNSILEPSKALACAQGLLKVKDCASTLREVQHGLVGCNPKNGDSLSCPHFAYREAGLTLLAALFVKTLIPSTTLPLERLVISPATASIPLGGAQTYSATGFDAFNNSLGDLTTTTLFSITPNGSCTTSTCTANSSGSYTVTGTNSGKTGTASLTVQESGAATASMTTARRGHSATLLTDGTVLVAGGGTEPSAEIFDPATQRWKTTGNLVTNRSGAQATLLKNGKVLLEGGTEPGGSTPLASAELYDPATGTWSGTAPMGSIRAGHTATLLPDGRVLVAGGYTFPLSTYALASAEIFDPGKGTWSPTIDMATTRADHTATLLSNGDVLVAGGVGIQGYIPGSEVFTQSDSWLATGPMAVPRTRHTSTILADGKVLSLGGTNDTQRLAPGELYDPAKGAWSAMTPIPTPRSNHSSTLMPDGRVFIAGGYTLVEGVGAMVSTVEIYEALSGAWSTASPLLSKRANHTATLLPEGRVLVAGGVDNQGTPLASAEILGG